ncbi:MAG TPA: hypothetical protein VFB58_04605 [Chloroflexota bacterium]|nr:hypothetical protein [Chloroflexota bacterium]
MKFLARVTRVVYEALIFLYPRDFRYSHGREMRQAFAASLSESAAQGVWKQLSYLGGALVDVASSGVAERTDRVVFAGVDWHRVLPVATGLGVLAGYAHVRSDDDVLLLTLLVALPFIYGVLRPLAAWVPALIIGIAVFAVQLASQKVVQAGMPRGDLDHLLLLPLLVAPAAALVGAMVRSAATGLATASTGR